MTPEQFTYWLQGYVEIGGHVDGLNADQWRVVRDHLKTVFHKVTPNYTTPNDKEIAPYIPNKVIPGDFPLGGTNFIC